MLAQQRSCSLWMTLSSLPGARSRQTRPTTYRELLAAEKGWLRVRCTAAVLELS